MNNWQFAGVMVGLVGVVAALITTLFTINGRIDGLYGKLGGYAKLFKSTDG